MLLDHVDYYCERTAPGLWNEPLNAFTNLAFIVSAYFLWRRARATGAVKAGPCTTVPIALLFLTGLGSLALHVTATRLGALFDTIALSACLLATVLAGAIRWLSWRWWAALAWPAGMALLAVAAGRWIDLPGASYLGALATGAALAVLLVLRGHHAWQWLAGALLIFLPSYALRTVDLPLCETLPHGTHFAWHVLNAVVLYLAIRPLTDPPAEDATEAA